MPFVKMHADEVETDGDLVRRLLAVQFPRWADLDVERVPSSGTDNAIYRVGTELAARLPRIQSAVGQVEKEHTWLPRLAPLLPLHVPEPMAMGGPGQGYPWPWSLYRWIDGETAHPDRIADLGQAAIDLAEFVNALHSVDLPDAPRSPRDAPLGRKDKETRWAIERLRHEFDADALIYAWDAAIQAPPWDGPRVWVHADLSDGNLLVRNGRLHSVIDYSCLGLGEPANDLDVAWDLFTGESREMYRAAVGVDDATWARGRGWAVDSVFGILYYEHTNPGIVAQLRRRLVAVIESVRSE